MLHLVFSSNSSFFFTIRLMTIVWKRNSPSTSFSSQKFNSIGQELKELFACIWNLVACNHDTYTWKCWVTSQTSIGHFHRRRYVGWHDKTVCWHQMPEQYQSSLTCMCNMQGEPSPTSILNFCRENPHVLLRVCHWLCWRSFATTEFSQAVCESISGQLASPYSCLSLCCLRVLAILASLVAAIVFFLRYYANDWSVAGTSFSNWVCSWWTLQLLSILLCAITLLVLGYHIWKWTVWNVQRWNGCHQYIDIIVHLSIAISTHLGESVRFMWVRDFAKYIHST